MYIMTTLVIDNATLTQCFEPFNKYINHKINHTCGQICTCVAEIPGGKRCSFKPSDGSRFCKKHQKCEKKDKYKVHDFQIKKHVYHNHAVGVPCCDDCPKFNKNVFQL